MNLFEFNQQPAARAMVTRQLDWRTMYYRTKDALDTAFVGIQRIAIDKDELKAQVERLQARNEQLWDMYIEARKPQNTQGAILSQLQAINEQSSTRAHTNDSRPVLSAQNGNGDTTAALEAHYALIIDAKDAQIEELREWCKPVYQWIRALHFSDKVRSTASDKFYDNAPECVKGGE